jgi:hypothetical protein
LLDAAYDWFETLDLIPHELLEEFALPPAAEHPLGA